MSRLRQFLFSTCSRAPFAAAYVADTPGWVMRKSAENLADPKHTLVTTHLREAA